jgi:hypothetical protein
MKQTNKCHTNVLIAVNNRHKLLCAQSQGFNLLTRAVLYTQSKKTARWLSERLLSIALFLQENENPQI